MLDRHLRPLIDPPLRSLARRLDAAGIRADQITLAGFGIGLLGLGALAGEAYGLAFLLLGLNRMADGLDGAVARLQGPSDFGGFLDIVCDFILYAGVPAAFALGRPEQALWAVLLIFSYMGTASSFLAFAVLAAKRGMETEARGRKSFFHLGGLAEGTETVLVMLAICLWPDGFPVLAGGYAALCLLTTLGRIWAARAAFGR